jgi:branched-chain amino acid transport system ATP-binding protein
VSAILTVEGLEAGYGDVRVLKGLSFAVEDGAIATIVGANGAGKTTTMRALSGILRPGAGSDIRFQGRRIDSLPPHEIVRSGLVMVPEGRCLFPSLTVIENLELGSFQPHAKAQRKQSLERVFSIFPKLSERAKQKAGTLSGGEQQMVAIARALMSLPRLLMLDEPSLGLAPVIVRTMFEVVSEINGLGTTVLLVEQNVQHALAVSSQAWVIENGEIVLSGTGESVLNNDHTRRAYLGL